MCPLALHEDGDAPDVGHVVHRQHVLYGHLGEQGLGGRREVQEAGVRSRDACFEVDKALYCDVLDPVAGRGGWNSVG